MISEDVNAPATEPVQMSARMSRCLGAWVLGHLGAWVLRQGLKLVNERWRKGWSSSMRKRGWELVDRPEKDEATRGCESDRPRAAQLGGRLQQPAACEDGDNCGERADGEDRH